MLARVPKTYIPNSASKQKSRLRCWHAAADCDCRTTTTGTGNRSMSKSSSDSDSDSDSDSEQEQEKITCEITQASKYATRGHFGCIFPAIADCAK